MPFANQPVLAIVIAVILIIILIPLALRVGIFLIRRILWGAVSAILVFVPLFYLFFVPMPLVSIFTGLAFVLGFFLGGR